MKRLVRWGGGVARTRFPRTFSAKRAYFPSSVTQSPAHLRRCAIKYLRMLCCGGRMTEHVSDSSAQCLRFTREFGSGCSVVCLISCRYSSHSNDSFRIDLSMTFCINVTCSSSALRTTSPNRIEEQSTVTQRNPIYATTVGKPLHLKRGYPYRFAPVQRISILSGTSARRSVRLVRTTG